MLLFGLQAEPVTSFHETPLLLQKLTDREIMVIQTCVFGQHSLKNEHSEPVTSKIKTDNTYHR